jgi:hypothetical protein
MKNNILLTEVSRIREMMGIKLLTEAPLAKYGESALEKLFLGTEKGIESAEKTSLSQAGERAIKSLSKDTESGISKKLESAGIRTLEDLAKIGEKGLERAEVATIKNAFVKQALKELEQSGGSGVIEKILSTGGRNSPTFKTVRGEVAASMESFGTKIDSEYIGFANETLEDLVKLKKGIESQVDISDAIKKELTDDLDNAIATISKNVEEAGGTPFGKSVEQGIEGEIQGEIEGEINDEIINDVIENGEKEAEETVKELSTSELIAEKISNMNASELKVSANEWFNKLKGKDFTKLSEEEAAWFIQLSEKGAFTQEQIRLITLDSPSIKDTANLLTQWAEYDKKYTNFREKQKFPTFEKYLESKGFKAPTTLTKLGGQTRNFFEGLSKNYVKVIQLGEMGTKEWWKAFGVVCLHSAVLFTGAIGWMWKKSGQTVEKFTGYIDDLTPLSNEQITEKVGEFLKYDDPKINGTSIFGAKDASANAGLRTETPKVTVLSAKEGTIQLDPGISVDGKLYTTFKFEPSDAAIGAGSESLTPHKMSTVSSTPPNPNQNQTVEADESKFKTWFSTQSAIYKEDPSKFPVSKDGTDKTIINVNTPSGTVLKYKVNSDGTTYTKQ